MTYKEVELLPKGTFVKNVFSDCITYYFQINNEFKEVEGEDYIYADSNYLISVFSGEGNYSINVISYTEGKSKQRGFKRDKFELVTKEEAKEINEYLDKVRQIEKVKPFQFPKQYIANKDVYFIKKGDILEIAKNDLYSVVGGDPKKFIHAEIIENRPDLFTEIK